MSKLLIIFVSALILGGCSLKQYLPGMGNAAKDQQTGGAKMTVSDSPAPSLQTQNDETSLETDLNNTVIVEEDFSDLK